MPRPKYPSDMRRWFRLNSDVGDATASLTDAEFRAFILVLAEANEQKAQDAGDAITIGRYRVCSLSPNKRGSSASSARVVRELCTKQSWALHEDDTSLTINVRNWSKFQGFTPTKLRRDSDETPATTPTPTPTTTLCVESAPKSTPKAPPKKAQKPELAWPEGGLSNEDKLRLVAQPSLKDHTKDQLRFAVETVALWAQDNGKRKRDWVTTIRGAIHRGWALEGYGGGNGKASATGRGNTNYTPAYESPNFAANLAGPQTPTNGDISESGPGIPPEAGT